MTAAQILALPTQTSTRLGQASDTGQWYVIEAGNSGAQASRLMLEETIITVADASARKNSAAYTPNGPSAGQTRVIQIDVPSILWCYRGGDLTSDNAWIGIPFTVEPDGSLDLDEFLRYDELQSLTAAQQQRVLGSLQSSNIVASDMTTTVFRPLGISRTEWRSGVKVLYSASVAPSGITVKTTTGYARGMRWDGVLSTVVGAADANAILTPTFGTAPASPYNAVNSKLVAVFPCNASGTITGQITYLNINSGVVTHVDIRSLIQLATLIIVAGSITQIDLCNLPALTTVSITSTMIENLTVSGCPLLTSLTCSDNMLRSLMLHTLPSLTTLVCSTNSLTELDLRKVPSLQSVTCSNNSLTSLLLSGLTSLTTLYASTNQLSSIDLIGLSSLSIAHVGGNNITSLSISGLTTLTQLTAESNPLSTLTLGTHPLLILLSLNSPSSGTGISSLDLTKIPNIQTLRIRANTFTTSPDFSLLTSVGEIGLASTRGITSVDLRNSTRPALFIDVPAPDGDIASIQLPPVSGQVVIIGSASPGGKYNALTSIRAVGGSMAYVSISADLSDTALNQFFTDLAAGTGTIIISGCTGEFTCNPTIATAKGYTVVTSAI